MFARWPYKPEWVLPGGTLKPLVHLCLAMVFFVGGVCTGVQSFTFSALNSAQNVEPTSDTTCVLRDRGLRFQPGQSHRKGSVILVHLGRVKRVGSQAFEYTEHHQN